MLISVMPLLAVHALAFLITLHCQQRIICEKHGHDDASTQHDMLETGLSS